MKRITIRDVAKQADVSIGTASRVINGAPNVEAAYRTRVLAAIKQLGFVPNRAAQEVRKGRSREIGIIVRDITTPVLASFVRAAQDLFEEAGYGLLICSSDNRKDRELELLRRFRQRRIEGLITTTSSEVDADLAQARNDLDFPVLMFDREVDGTHDIVQVDHASGVNQAVTYLLSLGHRRILLLTGPVNIYPARARVEGYKRAFAAQKLDLDPTLVRTVGFDAATGFRETAVALERANRPSAIIAGGIDMLPGVLKAIRATHLHVPSDISVIGGADSDLALLADPAISVLRWDVTQIGATCARMLLERIEAPGTEPRRLAFAPELVVRDSCAAVALVPTQKRESRRK